MEKKKFTRKLKAITSSIALFALLMSNSSNSYAQFGGGSGSSYDPYQISNIQHLRDLADSVNNGTDWSYNKHFILMNDITTPVTTMIGIIDDDNIATFQGNFDGRGHTITLFILPSITNIEEPSGLFGVISNATIKNLNVTGSVIGFFGTGGIAGYAESSQIINCNNNATINGMMYIGGIAGAVTSADESFNTTLLNCANTGSVNAIMFGGGIIGAIVSGSSTCIVNNCINIGSIGPANGTGTDTNGYGGIIGNIENMEMDLINIGSIEISNCINAGWISGTKTDIGGIIGRVSNTPTTIMNCINTGVVNGGSAILGLVEGEPPSVNNCFYDMQMCINDNGYGIGKLTREMTGTNLRSELGTSVNWTYSNNLYPTLTTLVLTEVSKVASAPIFLDVTSQTNYDKSNEIRKCFTVSKENNVLWKSESNIIEIGNNNIVNLTNSGNATLEAGIGTYKKIIPITTVVSGTSTCNYYNVTLIDSLGISTLKGAGVYIEGNITTIEAIPGICYNFINWTNEDGDEVSTENPYNITVNGNITLIANFEFQTFNLTVNTNDYGSVTNVGTENYNCGDTVTITATPDSCYGFMYWMNENDKPVSNENPLHLTVHSNTTLKPYFEFQTYRLILIANGNGSVTPNGTTTYDCGDTVTIIATPNTGYQFINWTDVEGNVFSDKPSVNIIMNANKRYTANFSELPTEYSVNLNSNPTGATLTGGGNIIEGTNIGVRAKFDGNCHIFINWTDGNGNVVSTENPFYFTVTRDTNLTANFSVKEQVLVVNTTPGGLVNIIGTSYRNCGSVVELIATPNNTGFVFKNWTNVNGYEVAKTPSLNVTVNSDTTLTANFVSSSTVLLQLHLNSNPTNAGTLLGSGTYELNEVAKIMAIANSGYRFVNWTNGSNVISSDRTYNYTVTGNATLSANFVEGTDTSYDVSISVSPNTMVGSLSGAQSGKYFDNTSGTVTAFPTSSSYEFVCWTGKTGKDTLTTNPTLNFTVRSDTSFVAHFKDKGRIEENIKPETISISPNPTNKDFIINFDVIKSSNIKIALTDLLGREVIDIYDNFADVGNFNKLVNVSNLTKGIYYLKIQIGNNTKIENVVIE